MAKITGKYVCPSCKKEQTTVIQWQTVSVAYKFNLKDGESEEVDKRQGDHESWNCPECGEDLPKETIDKVEYELGWK